MVNKNRSVSLKFQVFFNYRSQCYLYPLTYITGQVPSQCRIQQFFWVPVFRGEKPLCSWGVWGGTVSPPQWGAGANPREILTILHSE